VVTRRDLPSSISLQILTSKVHQTGNQTPEINPKLQRRRECAPEIRGDTLGHVRRDDIDRKPHTPEIDDPSDGKLGGGTGCRLQKDANDGEDGKDVHAGFAAPALGSVSRDERANEFPDEGGRDHD
jgi:hypothetical protein